MADAKDDHSDTESFKSAHDDTSIVDAAAEPVEQHFSPEEEAKLLAESNELKTTANAFFAKAAYTDAISTYSKALASCPTYLDYEVAVLRANIAACHIKTTEWKEAESNATQALDCLGRLDEDVGLGPKKAKATGDDTDASSGRTPVSASTPAEDDDDEDDRIQEVDEAQATRIERLEKSGRGLAEGRRLRVKALLRRARAREGLGGWANLAAAEEDYKVLLAPQLSAVLGPLDRRNVETGLREIRPRLEKAKQDEMGEMMGKLKDLGNGILKPFGLSTDMFKFEQGEGGGYSMKFDQNAGR